MSCTATRLAVIKQYFSLEGGYSKRVQRLLNRQPPIIPYDQLCVGDQYYPIQDTDMVIKLETEKHFIGIRMIAGGPCQIKHYKKGLEYLALQTR